MNADGDRFGVILASIVLSILAFAGVGDEGWGRFLAVTLLGVTLLLVLRLTEARQRVRLVAAVVVGAAIVGTAISSLLGEQGGAEWAVPMVGSLLALGAPVAIGRRLGQQTAVTFQTVLGALCLYLLAGLFFAFLYGSIAALTDGPFFAGQRLGGSIDFVYFSFVTITTVGFGDLAAVTDLGRMVAVSEALIGQLYLVVVVAVLVSNLGKTRKPRGE